MDYINKVKLGNKEYNIGGVYTISINEDSTVGDILDQLPINKEEGSINLFTVIVGNSGNGTTNFGYVYYSTNSEYHSFKFISRFPYFSSKKLNARTYEDLIEMFFNSVVDETYGNYAPSVSELLPGKTYDLKYQNGQVQWVLREDLPAA